MVRPRKAEGTHRVKLGTRMDPELYDWLQTQIGPGKRFKDFAHAIDFAVARLREEE